MPSREDELGASLKMRLRGYLTPGYEGGIEPIPSRVLALGTAGMEVLARGPTRGEGENSFEKK